MKKKILFIFLFLFLIVVAFIHSFYLTNLYSYDEIWNYGFAKNILDGLVPYKDFNMVVSPLFSYVTSIILWLFGEKLMVYHIFIAVLVVGITYLAFRKIGWHSLLIYVALLIYATNGYNVFSLLLLFVLFSILDKKLKYRDLIVPFLISLMILSKQTLVVLILPSLIYSTNRKKTLMVYLTCFLAFLVYLLIHNNFIQFVDYCLLGMFEFGEKNALSVPIYFILEILICFWLIYQLVRSKFQRQDIFYCLMFQVIALPITDISHFVLTFSSLIYVFFRDNNWGKFFKNSVFIVVLTILLSVLFLHDYNTTVSQKIYLGYSSSDTFLKGKLIPNVTESYIQDMDKMIHTFPDYKLYVLGNYSYVIKLALDIPINKYDLINHGNMGYHGSERYIQEIDEDCQEQRCLFIVHDDELRSKAYNQTSMQILEYVTKNYYKIYATSIFGVYITQ